MDSIIDELNGLLRGELSAVETYQHAVKALPSTPFRSVLAECQLSHEKRVGMIRSRLLELKGQPADGSGVWGVFARAVGGGATVLGEKATVAALEEGEDHGLKRYREISKFHPLVQVFMEHELRPHQEVTHRKLSDLKRVFEFESARSR